MRLWIWTWGCYEQKVAGTGEGRGAIHGGAPVIGHQGFVLGTAFDAGGERLYSGAMEGDVCVWDPVAGLQVDHWRGCHRGAITDLVVREEIVTGGLDGTAAVWTRKGQLRHRLVGHTAGVHAVAVHDRYIATASAEAPSMY